MKRIFAATLFFTVTAGFTACSKEELPAPATTTTVPATAIQVEYKVRGFSGNLSIEYIKAGANGMPVTVKETSNRNEINVPFSWTSGSYLFVKASNTVPSHDEVVVELYVNGELKKSASANNPGASAIAEGRW